MKSRKKAGGISGGKDELFRYFSEHGLDGMSEINTAELLLYFSGYRSGVRELAQSLIEGSGSLIDVFSSEIPALRKAGLSENAAVLFRMIYELYPSYASVNSSEEYRPADTAMLKDLFRLYFIGKKSEEFRIAAFGEDLTVKSMKLLPGRSPSLVNLDTRGIIEFLISSDACMTAVAHNHPNAGCQPSKEDRLLTAKIYGIAEEIDVVFADHIIVGARNCYSFRENGELPII